MIKATKHDKALIVDILTKAFDANQSVNHVVKQDEKRIERIKVLMDYSFEICSRFGDIYLSDDKSACALLLYPEKQTTNFHTILLDLKLMLKCIGLKKVIKVLNRNSQIKSHYPKQPLAYLWFIGVNTQQQGKGIGSMFLKDILSITDSQNKPMYLETSMLQNLPFYKKLGFKIYHELNFGHQLYLLKKEVV